MKAETCKTHSQKLNYLCRLRDKGKINTIDLHKYINDNSKYLEIAKQGDEK